MCRPLRPQASTDGEIRVYSQLEFKPLRTIDPNGGYLYDVFWSLARPLVFTAATSDGRMLIYDLVKDSVASLGSKLTLEKA